MQRFWEKIIEPILKELKPKHILEIGSQRGYNTTKILNFCEKYGSKLSSVDPFPLYDYEKLQEKYEDKFNIYRDLSLNVLADIKNVDVALIDGDHNWYTVYNELQLIFKNCDGKFPFIFCHDVGWPYGRRDLYYNPDNIPPYFQQPFKKAGILPEQHELVESGGLNSHLYNSIYENNNKNGVLTAIEDFIHDSHLDLMLYVFEGINGLAVIFEKTKENITVFENFDSIQYEISKLIEKERVLYLIELESIKAQVKNQENINSECINHLEKLNLLVDGKEKEISDYINKVAQLESHLAEKETENSDFMAKLKQSDLLIEEREKEISDYINKVAQLESHLAEKETENSDFMAKLKQSDLLIEEREKEISNYINKVAQLESHLAEKETENSDFVIKIKRLESLIEEKEKDRAIYKNKFEDSKQTISNLENLYSSSLQEEKNTNEKLVKLELDMKNIGVLHQELLQKSSKECEYHINQINLIRKEVDDRDKQISVLNESLEIIKNEYTKLYMENVYSFSFIVKKIKHYFFNKRI